MSPLQFQSSIRPNQGFHFFITTKTLSKPPSNCDALHLRFVLPPSVFADPYELDLHSASFSYQTSAHPDLELPVTAVDPADTILDISATSPVVTVPVHARYGRLQESSGDAFESIRLEYPNATLFCRSPGAPISA